LKKYTILFLMGKDRPGIVDDVSTFLFGKGANIEDSRMAVMGGCFSVMMLFSCFAKELENIRAGLGDLKALGFETSLHEAQAPETVFDPHESSLKMSVTSMDHPGIVRQVVRILRRYDVNIRSMNTGTGSAPLSGAPIFNMALEGVVPGGKQLSWVKRDLTALASEMNMDLSFLSEAEDVEI
jgi:glycine cleavage system transcriptional repressor